MSMRPVLAALGAAVLVFAGGCSSLGLTLWPAQFPLLAETKQFAANSPLPNGMPHELAKQVLDDYFIEPGDRLLIEPTELDSELRSIGDQQVQVDGSVDLGQFGRVRVAGMTVEMIEAAIAQRIEEISGESEQINVQLVETNAAEFYVLGEVGSPGAYLLAGRETVLDGILTAGGLTSRASPCDIILVRPTDPCSCRVVLPVCYRQITQLGDVSSNYQLQPGDRIVVGSRTLCEELAVWKQVRSCDRCNGGRCVERNPTRVGYVNRFLDWANPFSLHSSAESDLEEFEGEAVPAAPQGDRAARQSSGPVSDSISDRRATGAARQAKSKKPVAMNSGDETLDIFLPR